MMEFAKERKSNEGLLYCSNLDTKTKKSLNLVEAIAVERPFRDQEEARMSALALNNVMAFVEYGLSYHDSLPNDTESVLHGLEEIVRACRLVSLRVEQYLDLQAEGER